MAKRQIRLLLSVCWWLLLTARRAILRLAGKRPAAEAVLVYHVVKAHQRKRFAAQMDMLLRHARPARLEEIGQPACPPCRGGHMREGSARRAVAVTCDDAYRSFAQNALPELAARGIPVTIFVPAGWLGKRQTWADGYKGYEEYEGEVVMTAEELRALPKPLVSLASHSIAHTPLVEMSAADAEREMADSKRLVAEIAGEEVRLFAFPMGEWTPALADLCKRAGYDRVYSIEPTGVSGYVCGRIEVLASDWPVEFYLKMMGGYGWQPWLTPAMRRLRRMRRKQ